MTDIKVSIFQGKEKILLRNEGIGMIKNLISVKDYKKQRLKIQKKYRGYIELFREKIKELEDNIFGRDYVLEYYDDKIPIPGKMLIPLGKEWNVWLHLKPIYNVFKVGKYEDDSEKEQEK